MAPRNLQGKTYWIIGASEGLGRTIAREMSRLGAQVILSARSEDRLRDLAADIKGAQVLPLDVTDLDSVKAAVAVGGQADGLIYCVGQYDPMTAQEWNADKAEQICEANFMGAMRVLGRTVPDWAARDYGHIVLIGSLAAFKGLPGAIGYGASKAALRHLAEDMFIDLQGTGVSVQVANPGFIRTRLTSKNEFSMPQLMDPQQAAYHVMGLIRNPESRQISFPRPFAWVFTVLGRLLPFRLYARIVSG
ncbi:SDR family NAD(P)-dependent oxidoreductase [Pseudooceanicola sediminis]|uniref:SDR family NAD(P)-dependent oxidoreductase n=1 Tax=Pseudooceanicola sediminis TaxID=2211117 RepID=A0A399IZ41_9RHOB|nr:SDR family NAD(P)-dependent oxidoreductase [Pseudooceanicola sediminis]KAA2313430.1 SDR family NAD(P)-dependent oxidoreductase [Puniceibacterium sp. HSS470]RII38291.1 SDR family NAD(P)-dependent oxidoreductase [Pseudooceanicola sediminis]|tara:strand:+ start:12547 stop:13290 length:744 start_codon:yes stop_codon:yes gene_type:complete